MSRSATLVIALVMRASMQADASEELKAIQGSMHNAYAYVKEKSKWVGPNMSYVCYLVSRPRRSRFAQSDLPTVGVRAHDRAQEGHSFYYL